MILKIKKEPAMSNFLVFQNFFSLKIFHHSIQWSNIGNSKIAFY